MNKSELVAAVAEDVEVSKDTAGAAVDAVFNAIREAMKGGDEVRIPNFGTFKVTKREAREGTNPSKPGEKIMIPAANVPKFQAGKALKDALNS